jgi:hypothetical protein
VDHIGIATDIKGNYKFREYLDRFQILSKKCIFLVTLCSSFRQFMKQWEAEVISHICQVVNQQHKTLEQTFAAVDTNGDGMGMRECNLTFR